MRKEERWSSAVPPAFCAYTQTHSQTNTHADTHNAHSHTHVLTHTHALTHRCYLVVHAFKNNNTHTPNTRTSSSEESVSSTIRSGAALSSTEENRDAPNAETASTCENYTHTPTRTHMRKRHTGRQTNWYTHTDTRMNALLNHYRNANTQYLRLRAFIYGRVYVFVGK